MAPPRPSTAARPPLSLPPLPPPPPEATIVAAFATADTDGDGRLNRAEMQAAAAALLPNEPWDESLWPAMCARAQCNTQYHCASG
jgi:hypothetical protein